MIEPTVSPRDPFPWLSAEHQAKLATFKAYAVNHALLQDVDRRLMHAIAEPAGFAHVLVYGPSGVGKSTMLQQLHRRTAALLPHPAESRTHCLCSKRSPRMA
jgi:transcriptional regulator with AAA-type ATPase domain